MAGSVASVPQMTQFTQQTHSNSAKPQLFPPIAAFMAFGEICMKIGQSSKKPRRDRGFPLEDESIRYQ